MAIKDLSKKQYVQDRDEKVNIGIDLPFRRGNVEGWFASTSTTIDAIKNNIKNLLLTHQGERVMQPNIGLNLRNVLFEQFTEDLKLQVENDILDTFEYWLPFVLVRDLKVGMTPNPNDATKNRLDITVLFNIKKNPNSLESVAVTVGD